MSIVFNIFSSGADDICQEIISNQQTVEEIMSNIQEYIASVGELLAAWNAEKQEINSKFDTLLQEIEALKAASLVPESALSDVRATIEDIRSTVQAEVPVEPEPPTEEPVEPPVVDEPVPPIEDTLPGVEPTEPSDSGLII